jgi:dienelactone hydrolase
MTQPQKKKQRTLRAMLGSIALALALLVQHSVVANAQGLLRQELRIPVEAAGPKGLEAVLVRPDLPGRFPLALVNHGSPREASERPEMTPMGMLPELEEFARRGFVAVAVMRRGYGGSGGGWAETYGSCANPDYAAAAEAAASDLRASIAHLSTRDDVDLSRIISVGVSAGGFASVALTADPPKGLVAAISFAGARGSLSSDHVCGEDALVSTFGKLGAHSRVPMLWVFAKNDHFFGPVLAERLRHAFVAAGGSVSFVQSPAFGSDGHSLFSLAGTRIWAPLVDSFLRDHGLAPRAVLLPSPTRRVWP